VWHNRSFIRWTRLTALAFVATGSLLHADDKLATDDGYKIVPVNVSGKTIPIRVRDEQDPFKSISTANSTGKYDPEHIFSTSSSMANKDFMPPASFTPKGDTEFRDRESQAFITKPYVDEAKYSTPNLNSKATFRSAAGYDRNASGFGKSFATPTADAAQSRTAVFASSNVTADQNRAAVLGGPEKPEVFAANTMADKQYLGPGAQNVPDSVSIRENVAITRMSGLPNRDLSIDEVRDLINHGFKPNTDAKPPEPSKPLNDPDYKPVPLRDTPAPGGDDDKDDPVPAPGTMAAPQSPENSEPLPQR
jgi:hypothetical protein